MPHSCGCAYSAAAARASSGFLTRWAFRARGSDGGSWRSLTGACRRRPISRATPETKQREPDGIWEFDPAGAMRALHELDEHLRALREEETEDGALSLEEWLARQEGASAL